MMEWMVVSYLLIGAVLGTMSVTKDEEADEIKWLFLTKIVVLLFWMPIVWIVLLVNLIKGRKPMDKIVVKDWKIK